MMGAFGLIAVLFCDPAGRSGEDIALSAYGNTVLKIDQGCAVFGVDALDGPINVWTPRSGGGGIANVYGRPLVYDGNGEVLVDFVIKPLLLAGAPSGVVDSYLHHDVIETAWGTYMALAVDVAANGDKDDIIVEFNAAGVILTRFSLNMMIWGTKWGAQGLGAPFTPEDWLHSNSLDTRDDGLVLVSTRNIDKLQIIDWPTKTKIRHIGGQHLSLPHFARFLPNGDVRVFDNGAKTQQSSIVDLSITGTLLRRLELPFYAPAYGSVHELANGNWLTINGVSGDIYEFSPDISQTYMHLRYLAKDWIPFLKKYDSIIYRAYPL